MLELLVVISILALSLGIATPRLGLFKGALMRLDVAGLVSDLKTLREDAMYSGVQTALRVAPGGYRIEPVGVARKFWSEEKLSVRALPRWDGADGDGIVFFPDGSSSGGTLTLEAAGLAVVISIEPLTGHADQR